MEILEFILRLIIIFALWQLTKKYAHRNCKKLLFLTIPFLTLAVIEAIFFIWSPLSWILQVIYLFVMAIGVWIIIKTCDRCKKNDNGTCLEEKEKEGENII